MIKRALIVDDEQSIRSIVAQVLTEERYRVAEATSGEEAIAAFKKEPFPLVFTDIRMGGMSGLELLKNLKKAHHYHDQSRHYGCGRHRIKGRGV
jgi:two-component system response regulator HydG